MSDTSCLFCRIVAREIPAEILRESDRVLAFRDIDPKAPTHILLIPKEHLELARGHRGPPRRRCWRISRRPPPHLARTEGVDQTGWRLVSNVGPDAGQAVFHLHFHLLGGRPHGLAAGLTRVR